jgi:hypothetical protein
LPRGQQGRWERGEFMETAVVDVDGLRAYSALCAGFHIRPGRIGAAVRRKLQNTVVSRLEIRGTNCMIFYK